jgi:ERCC4-type nuclease
VTTDKTVAPFPAVILIDSREKGAYTFTGLRSKSGKIWQVSTRQAQLATGDYSVFGYEHCVAIERKSACDLFNTITIAQSRDRFTAELARLNALSRAHVVVEATWEEIFQRPPAETRLPPAAVLDAVLSWDHAFPSVRWWFMPGRRSGEAVSLRLLGWFMKGQSHGGDGADSDSVEGQQVDPLPPVRGQP